MRRCWVNFQCWGVLLIWIIVGQGPVALAVGAGGGCLDIFSLICPFSPLSPSLWETARYRLKYCLKGPLNPKQPTNQLYQAVSQREGERGGRIDESKNVQTTPTRTYCKRNRPLSYCNQNCRTPRHWKFTQHHRTTRPPPAKYEHPSLNGIFRTLGTNCYVFFSKKGYSSLNICQTARKNMGLLIFCGLFIKLVSKPKQLWFLRNRPPLICFDTDL